MSERPDRNSETEVRDERYGKALASLLRSAVPEGACLSPEELDALVEGSAPPELRSRCLAHLSSCDSCLRSFAVAGELRRSRPSSSRSWFVIATPWAVAAVLVLAVAVTLTHHSGQPRLAQVEQPAAPQPPGPGPAASRPGPTSGAQSAPLPNREQVAKAPPAKPAAPDAFSAALSLLASLPPAALDAELGGRRSFGFAGEDTNERRRFDVGADLLSARVALARGGRDSAFEQIKRAAARMPAAPGTTGVAELAGLVADWPSVTPEEAGRRLERLYTPAGPGVDSHLALGAWTRALLLAAAADNRALLASDWFGSTGSSLAHGPLPQECRASVSEILAAAAQARTPDDFARCRELARDLREFL